MGPADDIDYGIFALEYLLALFLDVVNIARGFIGCIVVKLMADLVLLEDAGQLYCCARSIFQQQVAVVVSSPSPETLPTTNEIGVL